MPIKCHATELDQFIAESAYSHAKRYSLNLTEFSWNRLKISPMKSDVKSYRITYQVTLGSIHPQEFIIQSGNEKAQTPPSISSFELIFYGTGKFHISRSII